MGRDAALEVKQKQFNAAMELYEKGGVYKLIGKLVSLSNVALQFYLLSLLFTVSISLPLRLLSVFAAYLVTDFISGLVHMYMDSNDNYDSPAGPIIAAFHLHHRTPLYKKNNILLVYFNESGSKIWLVGYLLTAVILLGTTSVHPVLASLVIYVGILSSIAEVSHYCCHVTDSRISRLLICFGLFLPKKHHGRHHVADNVNYAFLNGMTDPLLNIIARKISRGYKNTTDRHYAAYTGSGSTNR